MRKVVVTSVGDLLGFPKGAIVDFVVRHVRHQVPTYHLAGAVRFHETLQLGGGLELRRETLGHADLAFLQFVLFYPDNFGIETQVPSRCTNDRCQN